MNILFISPHFPPMATARSLQAKKLFDALKEQEETITLVSYSTVFKKYLNCNFVRRQLYHIQFLFLSYKTYKTKNPEILITLSSPLIAHMAGLIIKLINKNTKWITFFSDPTPLSILPAPYNKLSSNKIFESAKKQLTKKVLKKSSFLIMPSKYGIEYQQKQLNLNLDSKSLAIPHIGNIVSSIPKPKLPLALKKIDLSKYFIHFGDTTCRLTEKLLIGIKNAKSENFNGIILIGNIDQATRKLISDLSLEAVVLVHPPVEQSLIPIISSKAKALLLVEAEMNSSPFLPSKFADYCLLDKPILAVTPRESSISDYLTNNNNNYSCSHDSKEIEIQINNILHNYTCKQTNDLKNKFQAPYIAKQYIDVFKEVMNND